MTYSTALSPISMPLLACFALFSGDRRQYVGGGPESRTKTRIPRGVSSSQNFVTAPGSPANNDAVLIEAMGRGDERAAATLYDRYSGVLFALAVRIVGNSADAEDVVLDAFTQAWNSASRYESNRGSVLGWLTTITRTRALDVVRARGRRTKAVDTASRSMGDDPVGVAGATVSAAEVVEQKERASAVTSAMAVLSGQQRHAIELAFFEGLTHTEIAERLGEPLGTIKTRIRLGMLKLRDALRFTPTGLVS
ncbi:MAG: sigma-70 family RNA polymerase sigma factor [Gemmatimonadota bacterium]|nr:sigma-70 family RNA polymerase sigma factor [Gemmatimonadota bacterium]